MVLCMQATYKHAGYGVASVEALRCKLMRTPGESGESGLGGSSAKQHVQQQRQPTSIRNRSSEYNVALFTQLANNDSPGESGLSVDVGGR
jgi:hypothetical protein